MYMYKDLYKKTTTKDLAAMLHDESYGRDDCLAKLAQEASIRLGQMNTELQELYSIINQDLDD